MKILVAGGKGFIGRWVVKELKDVLILQRDNLHEVSAFSPEVVINLAWNGVSGLNVRTDDEIQKSNVIFNEHLFELCKSSCKRWIGAGSQLEVNGPEVPYAKYKLIVLDKISKLCSQNNISFAWARIYSTYGPGDNQNNFLPYLINELLAGNNVPLTNQNIPWDYLYVEDAAKAIIKLVDSQEEGVFELGSGKTHMTQNVAKLIRDKINPIRHLIIRGSGPKIRSKRTELLFGAKPCRAVELKELVADITRLKSLGWYPKVSLEEGIDKTIGYFRSYCGNNEC